MPLRRTPTLAGMSLQVTVPNISTLTNLGSITYEPGIAQSLSSLASAMSDPTQGAITQTVKNIQNQSTGLNGQIAFYAGIVSQQQQMLLNQYRDVGGDTRDAEEPELRPVRRVGSDLGQRVGPEGRRVS